MGKGKPRGLNSARKLRVHRRNKYVQYCEGKHYQEKEYNIMISEYHLIARIEINH